MRGLITKIVISLALAVGFLTARFVAGQTQAPGGQTSSTIQAVPAISPFIETHGHFNEHDPEGSIRAVIAGLSRENAAKIYLLIPPDTYEHPGVYDLEVIRAAAEKYPDKVGLLGGGGTLNAMIQKAVRTGNSGAEIRKQFKDTAEKLIRDGAEGFGEMTAEHFETGTPYQYAPPDHPLFLMLADIAAQHNVPINLHMEAIPQAMPLPSDLKSPPNPPQLHENIPEFERLLSHNPRAKIIWAHAGSDMSGYRTPELCRRLLRAYPNLYMDLKADPDVHGKNFPLENGKLKPDWLKLFQDFPDRFVIGSDQRYPEPPGPQQRWQTDILVFNQLPAELRKKIGMENPLLLYRAKQHASAAKQ